MNKKIVPAQHNPQPNQQNNAGRLHRVTLTQRMLWVGPLPDPNTLQGYENACKGAANRIIKMTENQSQHRQRMEEKVISSNIKNEGRGMIFAFILTGGLAVIGAWLISSGKEVVGWISLFGPSLFHAGNYIYGKYGGKPVQKEKELEDVKKKERNPKDKKLRNFLVKGGRKDSKQDF